MKRARADAWSVLNGINNIEDKNTVEVFDHIANTWTYMPSTVERRSVHSLVAIKSKLFVVGIRNCETYDEDAKVFTIPLKYTGFHKNVKAISIGNKIALRRGLESRILFLDIGSDRWCEKVFDFFDKSFFSVFIKIPQM